MTGAVWISWRSNDRLRHYADRLEEAALTLVDSSLDMLIADIMRRDCE